MSANPPHAPGTHLEPPRSFRRLFGFSHVGFEDDAEAPKATGESVPSPEQDKAEVVRAVVTRREIGVVTSAAAETARDHRHATLLLWPAAIPPPHFYSAGGSRCGTHPWRRH